MHRNSLGGERAIVDSARGRRQQRHRLDPDPPGNAFNAFQGQVILAALQSSEVGAVHADRGRKRFLAETAGLPETLQALTYRTLKATVHQRPQDHRGHRSSADWP